MILQIHHRPGGEQLIRQRRAGWQVLVYAGIDPVTGRQRYITRQVNGGKRAAEREEARLRAEVAAGKHRGTGAKTMAELLDVWFEWRTTNGKPLSPATRNDYESLVNTKLKPALGNLRLPQVDAAVLDRYYGRLLTSGRTLRIRDGKDAATGKPKWRTEHAPLSASRIHQVHAVLSGALGLATRYGWIPFNPTTLAEPPAGKGKRRAVPSTANVREVMLVTAERDPELFLFLRLEAITGARPGEVVALRWCDVDLDAPAVTINGNVVHTRGLPGGYVRKPPKSEHGERLLAIDLLTASLLRAHQERCEKRAKEWGGKLAEDAYLFAKDEAGRHPMRRDTIGKRFGKLAATLGHGYTLYGLRHYMATQLGAVATAATVRERMGHGSLAVTGIYVHQVSEADRAAALHMSGLLDGESPRL
jgi:integrase